MLLVTVVGNVIFLVGMFAYSNQTDQDLDASQSIKLETPLLGKDSFNFVPDRSLTKHGFQRMNKTKGIKRKASNNTIVEEHDRVLQEKALRKFQGSSTNATRREQQLEGNNKNGPNGSQVLADEKEFNVGDAIIEGVKESVPLADEKELNVGDAIIEGVKESVPLADEKELNVGDAIIEGVKESVPLADEKDLNVGDAIIKGVKESVPLADEKDLNVGDATIEGVKESVPLADNTQQKLNQPVKFTISEQAQYQSGRKKNHNKNKEIIVFHEAEQLHAISKDHNKQIGNLQGNNKEMERIVMQSKQSKVKADKDTNTIKDIEQKDQPVWHYMTIDPPKGGLGNQVFQLAALVGLAKRHNYSAFLPMVGFNINEAFMLPRDFYKPISLHTFRPVHNYNPQNEELENTKYKYLETLDNRGNWSLNGYFQSYRYFWDAREEVRAMLKLKKRDINKADLFLKEVPPDHKKVGIHVRRGDFLTLEQTRLGRVAASQVYLSTAVTYFIQKFGGKVTFVVISDDISWCRYNINRGNLLFSNFGETGTDLALMSKCDHAIITVGTFSWWSGFLTGGIVIYYDEYPRRGSELYDVFVKEDYYPKEWIGMNELNRIP
ncbi:uncharacterized protein LOC127853508 [Dreissena polymorpha]|uniref:uncharacterized protein LOC127853508 n=1 Tax=Dreissena polymorpha TaxID=45954 RepID=UPI002264C99F|nr:uncharacterized protein LOC127853508 [Dreissena polymorpha]